MYGPRYDLMLPNKISGKIELEAVAKFHFEAT